MNQLPVVVTSKIISRLSSVKEKVRCKTLSKCWKDAAVCALSLQECLSFDESTSYKAGYIPRWIKCWDTESHVCNNKSQLNIKVISSERFRRKFFSEFCCLKVIRFPENENFTPVWKYYLTEGSYQHLECLEIYHLEFPVNLPNLRHFLCEGLTVEALNSIINNSPHLTQLIIVVYQLTKQERKPTEDFSDALSRLPLGLEYLRINCYETDVFAVLSSPAMTTIKCLCFDKVAHKETGSFKKLQFRPSPKLEIFGFNSGRSENRRYSNTLLDYLRTAKNMKEVELDTSWLSIEDRVILFNEWSSMTRIILGSMDETTALDELIDVILKNNRDTLDKLALIDFCFLNRDSWEKLGNFPLLKKLVCYDTHVSFIIFEKQEVI